MKVDFEITHDDLIKFNHYAILRSKYNRRFFYSFLIAISFIIAILFFLISPSLLPWSIFSIIIWIAGFSLLWFRVFLAPPIKTDHNDKRKGFTGKHAIEINEQGLREKTEVNDTIHSWKDIKSIEETDEYIYAHIGPLVAHVIPKRTFTDQDDTNRFSISLKNYFMQARGHKHKHM
jgi:predicted membrane protein